MKRRRRSRSRKKRREIFVRSKRVEYSQGSIRAIITLPNHLWLLLAWEMMLNAMKKTKSCIFLRLSASTLIFCVSGHYNTFIRPTSPTIILVQLIKFYIARFCGRTLASSLGQQQFVSFSLCLFSFSHTLSLTPSRVLRNLNHPQTHLTCTQAIKCVLL